MGEHMSYFNKIKIKYRVILICSIPFFILFYFVVNLLHSDYKTINDMARDTEIIKVYQSSLALGDALLKEKSVSLFYLKDLINLQGKGELQISREETDRNLALFKDMMKQNGNLSFNEKTLHKVFEPLNEKLELIKQKRTLIDSKLNSQEETQKYFDDTINKLVLNTSDILQTIYEIDVLRSLFTHLYIYLEKRRVLEEWQLISVIEAEEEISEQDYRSLISSIAKQEAFLMVYLTLSESHQDAAREQLSQAPSFIAAQAIREEILSNKKFQKSDLEMQKINEIFKAKISLLSKIDEKLIEDSIKQTHDIRNSKIIEFLVIVIALLITIPLSIILVLISLKGIVKRLQEEILTLSKSGQEIVQSINEASSGTEETATSVAETTTTVEELKQTAQMASEKAKNVADISNDTIVVLRTGEKSLEETIEGMHRIQNGMTTISESIIKLSEHSQSIGEIIETVNELAEQSHLLAINAAIEAAKAGDQGKGFSVVAQEVRSLAEQSKQATIQVKALLNDIQNSTSAAVMATEQGSKAVQHGVNKSGQINDSIRSLSKEVSKMVDASAQITLSSEQQVIGVNQVNIAMSNIKLAAEQHVTQIRQIEQAIQGMNAVGKSLKEIVIKF
jgi:methyl-accepting chemotaxis protein